MDLKRNIKLKRTVILSLIGFVLYFTIGMTLLFIDSAERDTNHLKFADLTGKIDAGVLNARINIDEILLKNNYDVLPELRQNFDSVKNKLKELNLLLTANSDILKKKDLPVYMDIFNDIHEKLDFLEEEIYLNEELRAQISDTLLFSAFNQFNMSYLQLESYFPKYLMFENRLYKREIIILTLANFLIILLAGFLIIRLINQLIKADRLLIQNTIEVENRERERIASDLHDGLGSFLSGLIIHLQVMEKENEDDPVMKEKLRHLYFLSNQALQSIEEIINNLNPSVLSRYGLIKTLQKIIQKINLSGKTQFHIDTEKLNVQFPGNTEVSLYRICMELINNTMKHSRANSAGFYFYNKKKQVHLVYRDNGIGFAMEKRSHEDHKGGLYNLFRRVEAMEGTCRIQSQPDKGIEVEIIFNLN